MNRKTSLSLVLAALLLVGATQACNLPGSHATPSAPPLPSRTPRAGQPNPPAATAPATLPASSPADGVKVFYAVHVETRDHATSSASVSGDWPLLANLVAAADAYGHKLTLEFQPQWAEYALAHAEALAQMRAWEANGHEIAFHHHGLSHASWDGYTDTPGKTGKPKYRGDMQDALALLNQLPVSGKVYTAGMTDEESDWPAGVVYATGESGSSGGGLVSTPAQATYNGVTVTQVAYHGYAISIGEARISLADVEQAIQQAGAGQVIGLVSHPFDYANDAEAFTSLFEMLLRYGIQTTTVRAILSK